jgi:hypothetical protein
MTVAMIALPAWAMGESSSVESFTSMVNTGSVKQNTVGADNRQDLNVGSASSTRVNSFNATVRTGSITQSSRGSGIVQSANIGSTSNANVNSFNAVVTTGNIEQQSTRSGDRQELDIGSVNNSTINGAFTAKVTVKDGVRQTDSGEIVLGSVKNSNIQNFSTTLDVKGTVTGNNIRIGSIVGQERYNKRGQSQGQEQTPDNSSGDGWLKPNPVNYSGKQGNGQENTLTSENIWPESPKSSGSIDSYTYALLSSAVYSDNSSVTLDSQKKIEDLGWVKIEDDTAKFFIFPDPSGFHAAAYKKGDQIVIVFEGTNMRSDEDVATDIAQWSGIVPLSLQPQYKSAAYFVEKMKEKYGKENNITLAGHSLGGALAQYAGGMTGLHATTFNSAKLRSPVLEKIRQANPSYSDVVNYTYGNDLVSQERRGTLIGETINVGDGAKGSLGYLKDHSIDNFIKLMERADILTSN